jgi:hypothetical protein
MHRYPETTWAGCRVMCPNLHPLVIPSGVNLLVIKAGSMPTFQAECPI